jgi:short-subunit dehydrogenase
MATATPGTALITGASTGIGRELAKLFAADHYRLILTARQEQRLNDLAAQLRADHGIEVSIYVKDLVDTTAPDELFAAVEQQGDAVDVLVNNAGFGTFGFFAESDVSSQLNMIQLNATALTHLSRLYLPGMLRRGRGKILNVASTAAFQPGPLMSVYYATKAYVLSFSEALADEVSGSGVRVSVLCPGPTTTEFQERAGMNGSGLLRLPFMDAASVARIGYRGLMRNRTVIIPGLRNKILAHASRHSPRKMVTRLVRRLQGKVDGS